MFFDVPLFNLFKSTFKGLPAEFTKSVNLIFVCIRRDLESLQVNFGWEMSLSLDWQANGLTSWGLNWVTGKTILLSHNTTSFLLAPKHKTTGKLSPASNQMETPLRFTFFFTFCIGLEQKSWFLWIFSSNKQLCRVWPLDDFKSLVNK